MVKKKTKTGVAVKSLRGIELSYQKNLMKLAKFMVKAVNEDLLPYLKTNQSSYTMDGIADDLARKFDLLRKYFSGFMINNYANQTAEEMVNKTFNSNKDRFNKSVERVTEVNLGEIIATEGLDDFVKMSVAENVKLITTLPEQYLSQIETIVTNGVKNGKRYSEIAKQITSAVGSANAKLANRIKTIARNEVQTINSQLTLRRSQTLGITKGIYQTSEDERVRRCHAELNGVEFDIAKGAWSKSCGRFIQPGITDINCRCSYRPIINLGA